MFSSICSESILRKTINSIIPSNILGRYAGNISNGMGAHNPKRMPAKRNNQKYFSIKKLILICLK